MLTQVANGFHMLEESKVPAWTTMLWNRHARKKLRDQLATVLPSFYKRKQVQRGHTANC
jgi:hypothetical protein